MKRKKHEFDEHDDAGTDDLSANGLEQQATDTDPGPTDGDAAAELAQAEAKIQDLSEKYQRALAEMENARKRHQREMADYRVTAVSSFARELLGVLDNLDRAITGLPDDQMDDPVKGKCWCRLKCASFFLAPDEELPVSKPSGVSDR